MKQFLSTMLLTIAAVALVAPAHADNFMKRLFNSASVRGSGHLVTRDRQVPEFNKIRSTGSFDVNITVGKTQQVTVTIDDNLIDFVKTEVKGKTLRIYSEESFSSSKGGTIDITVPELRSIDSRGSGDFTIRNLKGDLFEYTVAGSGDAVLDGEINELDITISGSGDVNARDLVAHNAYVSVAGSGDVRVNAKNSFDGRIAGSGDIDVYGKPAHVRRRVSGSGDITEH